MPRNKLDQDKGNEQGGGWRTTCEVCKCVCKTHWGARPYLLADPQSTPGRTRSCPQRGGWVAGEQRQEGGFSLHKNSCAFGTLKPVERVTYSKPARIERKDKDRHELKRAVGRLSL